MIGSLKTANRKQKELELLGRWRVLINGVLNTHSSQISKRWQILIKGLSRQGLIELNPLNTKNVKLTLGTIRKQ
jgi:hypothetical protein